MEPDWRMSCCLVLAPCNCCGGFIITVLIIAGFAKISAKFIKCGTDAILPTEIELTASIGSAIGVG